MEKKIRMLKEADSAEGAATAEYTER